MPRYRKIPVVVEAIQFNGYNLREIAEFTGYRPDEGSEGFHEAILVETPEGEMCATVGYWIIRGVVGEVYICRPEMFEQTYLPAEDWEAVSP